VFVVDRDSVWDNRSRRYWTTLASIAVEIGVAAGLLLISLVEPQGPPLLRSIESSLLEVPAGGKPRTREHPKSSLTIKPIGDFVLAPRQVPPETADIAATDVAPPSDFWGGDGIEGGRGSDNLGSSLWDGVGTGPGPALVPRNPPPSNHPPRISESMEGSLIHRVQPEYPPLAKQARIQGTVLLHAVIDREGKIENLQVLGGHPLLVKAALKAVQQWRYRPYYLNGQPVEVETEITVHFMLSGG
jgi:periplasmic protein TonB